jgi:oligoribonuclease NrnB/cAMP/cGMP phosphodiesterase (DHH superfamily)
MTHIVDADIVVMYHADCADGFGAAFAAWKSFGDFAAYMPVKYGQAVNFAELLGKTLYILDFSFPKETMEQVLQTCKRVVWFDHHKGAFETWCGKYYKGMEHREVGTNFLIHLDDSRSGALIAWEYFNYTAAPQLIRHIDDYDRWQFKLEGTKEFIKALWSKPFNFNAWDISFFTEGYTHNAYEFMYTEGAAILRAHEQNVQAVLAASKMECSITWYESKPVPNPREDNYIHTLMRAQEVVCHGLAANCPPHLASDIGHHLATESGTYGLVWYQDSNSRIKCSLRSNGDFDVAAIAKKFGGGGHMNAAGFELGSMSQLQEWFYPDRRSV